MLLILSALSFVSIMVAINKSNISFKEILIVGDSVTFYFLNKKRSLLLFPNQKFRLFLPKIKFKSKETNELIGRAFKNRIV
jgi:hypothetical protein